MDVDMSSTEYDLVIIGGGLVGGSLAFALGQAGLRVCLVEAVSPRAKVQPSYDERVIALSWGSRMILEGMGLWSLMAAEAEPIRQVHVSERGHFGFARLDHREEGVDALGYVAPARLIGRTIRSGLGNVDVQCPARLVGFCIQDERVGFNLVFMAAQDIGQLPCCFGIRGIRDEVPPQFLAQIFDAGRMRKQDSRDLIRSECPLLAQDHFSALVMLPVLETIATVSSEAGAG